MKMIKKERIFIACYVLAPVVVFILMKLRVSEQLLSEEDMTLRYGYIACYLLEGIGIALAAYAASKLPRLVCIVVSAVWCVLIAGTFLLKPGSFYGPLMPMFMDEPVTLILTGAYLGCGLMALFRRNEEK